VRFVADFHIHSHYSRATTPQLTPENLDYWSRVKGIHVMGTGDAVHPKWLDELRGALEPSGNGLFRLRPDRRRAEVASTRLVDSPLNFLLTTEISSIYKKAGRVRKVHNIIVLPDFEAAERLAARLAAIGNITSDGRPILGLDAKHLLEIMLTDAPGAYMIPAHIWTPWFSVLGSQSGFDRLEECFEDLTSEIFAVETGLSSDPAMNRVCSFLDRFRLVSNSDAHSPEKLGREANLFDTDLSYSAIRDALKFDRGFTGTIEFFPQEGKYHYDGHRKCEVRWDPLQTLQHGGRCSGCDKPVTRGVMYRVAQLADRPDPAPFFGNQRHWSITPLPAVLAEFLGQAGTGTQRVRREYARLTEQVGSEFDILLWAGLDQIRRVGGERLAEGIGRLRAGEVAVEEGYDGEFGRIRVFREELDAAMASLFRGSPAASAVLAAQPASEAGSSPAEPTGARPRAKAHSVEFDVAEFQRRLREQTPAAAPLEAEVERAVEAEQRQAIAFGEGVCVVLAGPGSGKTYTLTERIVHLIRERGVGPEAILAVTFSNKAADEIRRRVAARLDGAPAPTVATFHALGLSVLREHAATAGLPETFTIVDDEQRREIAQAITGDRRGTSALLRRVEAFKQGGQGSPSDGRDGRGSAERPAEFGAYQQALADRHAVDLDDLIWRVAELLTARPAVAEALRVRFRWLLVDEVQDLNRRQYDLLRLLGGAAPNLLAIGDPDQAIYGFRGADVRLIQRLQADYPQATVVTLARSFRCPSVILQGAGQMLQKRRVIGGVEAQVKIHIQQCPTDRAEAEWIAQRIEQMIGGTRSLSMHRGTSDGVAEVGITGFRDFAVLCRTTLIVPPLLEALAVHGIPAQLVGAEPFYRQEPWAAAISRLRTAIVGYDAQLSPLLAQGAPVASVLRHLVPHDSAPELDWQRMRRFAERFGADVGEFLRALALRQPVDDYDHLAERVSVMTMHASKGLEFPVVFVPACEQRLIPFELFGTPTAEELAEEARLFYVAMTRTKRFLFLSHAGRRMLRGKLLAGGRSLLLDRVERELLQLEKQAARVRAKDEYAQLSMFGEGR
jgi:uncharacterized protein (TIGR00375 family)